MYKKKNVKNIVIKILNNFLSIWLFEIQSSNKLSLLIGCNSRIVDTSVILLRKNYIKNSLVKK